MELSNIPKELTSLRQWVAYRLVPSKTRPGKTDKIPVNPRTGENAKNNDPATWDAFEAAVAAVKRYNLAGVGFEFTEDDPYTGVDLDDVIDAADNPEPWVLGYIGRLDSYTERSQSRKGLHIIVKAVLPPGGRKKGHVEMYDSGRFFALTGDIYLGLHLIGDRQAEIEELHADVFGVPEPVKQVIRPSQPVTLADADLIAKAENARNGGKFSALWNGSITGYPSHSEADFALAGALLFWTGGDEGRADSLFRQSGLYREKWDKRHYSSGMTYGEATLQKALSGMTEFYSGNGHGPSAPVLVHVPDELNEGSELPTARPAPVDAAAPTSGQDAGRAPTSGQDAPATAPRKRITSADLVDFLTSRGYSFRLNEADDSIEANGERMSDVINSRIRCQLRDAGLGKYLAAADDARVADAARHAYHPVRDYLESLTWDGGAHIAKLAGYVQDTNNVFSLYLRKWLIGSVARAYTGTQNAVLVLDGLQGIGKSQFVRWLCPLPKLFVDSNINPDDKDCSLLALRAWVWEVSELGATIKRADVEALKGFLSREQFTLRPPYGHYDIVKPALASFIGTVNNSSGIFSDSTGSRRFWATTVTGLNWQYERDIDIHQVWAEAMQAYQNGESWTLTKDQAERASKINQDDYAVSDPVEDLLRKHYNLDPARGDMWTSTADILQTLQNNGLGQNARANSMYLAATLKSLGHVKGDRNKVRGYLGIW